MADTAYDSDRFRKTITGKGAKAVIPNNPSRARKYPLDKQLYAPRHLIECCFAKLKQFRRIANRYEKTARNYRAMIALAATILWLKYLSTLLSRLSSQSLFMGWDYSSDPEGKDWQPPAHFTGDLPIVLVDHQPQPNTKRLQHNYRLWRMNAGLASIVFGQRTWGETQTVRFGLIERR